MLRSLSEQVVVVVGASSDIGRLATLKFAEKSATVVLASRNEIALREVAHEIERDRDGMALFSFWRAKSRPKGLIRRMVAAFQRMDG